jgi:hypothetical protein
MPSYIDLPYLGKNASVAVKRGWGVVRFDGDGDEGRELRAV